eukprot:5101633-Pyramimonas_sp.AAC.1
MQAEQCSPATSRIDDASATLARTCPPESRAAAEDSGSGTPARWNAEGLLHGGMPAQEVVEGRCDS